MEEPTRRDLERQSQRPLDDLPICVASRMATCFAESLEGCVAGHEAWGVLARYRTRLLLAPVPEGADRNEELKRRLRLWENGDFECDHSDCKDCGFDSKEFIFLSKTQFADL